MASPSSAKPVAPTEALDRLPIPLERDASVIG